MIRTTRMRWPGQLVCLVLLLTLAVLAAGSVALIGSLPRLDGTRHVAGLHAPVSITRDALGVATFTGTSRADIDYALGYVEAQERFFDMDLMRRLPAGELSELVGPAALPTDIKHRVHRLRTVAEAAYATLPLAQRAQLDRYRDGVNAGLADLHVRPWEYMLLHTHTAPWRSEDALLVIAAMYLDLEANGGDERELRIAQLRAALPRPLADFLLAPDPDTEAALDGSRSPTPVAPGPDVLDLRAHIAPDTVADARAVLRGLSSLDDGRRPGSNNFAIAGALTGGGAILANDMHLALRVPNIWFRARLHYPDPSAPGGERDVNGVAMPGTPAMVVGSNGQVAWGFTDSYGDWADWVRIVRDPADPRRYRVPDGWATLVAHREVIHVKGASDRVLDVQDTRYGPVMASDTDGTPLALDWIGDLPRAYNVDISALEHAASTHEALMLATTLGIPPENMLAADAQGHIGWTIAGNSIPLRSGNYDPLVPADWSQPGTGWTGWAAPTDYPRIEDPANGRLWTANNRTVGGAWLALLGNGGHDLGARAQQIRDDLDARNHFTPADLLAIQLDDRAVLLTRWQQLLQQTLAGTQSPGLAQLRELTAYWSGHADPASVDYRLVRAFRQQVQDAVLAPFVEHVQQRFPDFAWPGLNDPEAAVWTLIQARPIWLLDPRYADWHSLLTASAQRVVDTLGNQPGGLAARSWGEINRTDIRHPLSRALPGLLARELDMPDRPLPGDSNMPRVGLSGFGASERLDVMPGHEAQAILHMPGGQGDHPLSPYYGAGENAWFEGHATPLLPGTTQHTLTLAPPAG